MGGFAGITFLPVPGALGGFLFFADRANHRAWMLLAGVGLYWSELGRLQKLYLQKLYLLELFPTGCWQAVVASVRGTSR